MALESLHLIDRDGGGNISRRVSASSSSPAKRCTSQSGMCAPQRSTNFRICGEPRDRKNARHDARSDSRGRARVPEPQIRVVVVEELRDRASRARVDLAFQVIEIEARARRLRMHLGVRCHGNLKVCDRFQVAHQIGRVRKTVRMRRVARHARGRIAAQRNEMANAASPIVAREISSTSRLVAPTQVRCGAPVSAVSAWILATRP